MALALRRAHSFSFTRVPRVPMVSVPEIALWKDSGVCGRNSYVDSRCWKSQAWRSGTIQARQDATVRLIRGVRIARTMFWYAPESSSDCLPTRHFPQWRGTVVGA
eukprot:8908147-Pyramimonas_sp.AAC.1